MSSSDYVYSIEFNRETADDRLPRWLVNELVWQARDVDWFSDEGEARQQAIVFGMELCRLLRFKYPDDNWYADTVDGYVFVAGEEDEEGLICTWDIYSHNVQSGVRMAEY